MKKLAIVLSTVIFLTACGTPKPPTCDGEKRPINKQTSMATKAAIAAEGAEK